MKNLALCLILTLPALSGCMSGDEGTPLDGAAFDAAAEVPEVPFLENPDPPVSSLSTDESQETPETKTKPYPNAIVMMSEFPNVYHEAFRRPDWTAHPSTYVPDYPEDALPLRLSLDASGFEEAMAADQGLWDALIHDQWYYIPGTAFIGFRIASWADRDGFSSHGTGVAGQIVGVDANQSTSIGIVVDLGGTAAMVASVALANPWIDLTTKSAINIINIPHHRDGGYANWLFVQRGGIALNAVPNAEASRHCPISITCVDSGPPWVVAVGRVDYGLGFEQGETIGGQGPLDISAPHDECALPDRLKGTEPCRGTSFATPRVAGDLASLLGEVREHWGWDLSCAPMIACTGDSELWPAHGPLSDGGLSRDELLHAVYATARPGTRALVSGTVPSPLNDQGWGILDNGTMELARRAIWGDMEMPSRPDAEKDWEFHQGLRHAYWDRWLAYWQETDPYCDALPLLHCVPR